MDNKNPLNLSEEQQQIYKSYMKFMRAARSIQAYFNAVMENYAEVEYKIEGKEEKSVLTLLHIATLNQLYFREFHGETITQNELSQKLVINKTEMSRIARNLTKMGLIEKPEGTYLRELKISEKGKKKFQEIFFTHTMRIEQFMLAVVSSHGQFVPRKQQVKEVIKLGKICEGIGKSALRLKQMEEQGYKPTSIK